MSGDNIQLVSRRNVNVLLISPFDEDHQHLRDILRTSVWQQYGARSQTEALEFLRDNQAAVAICESELPDGTWRDLLTRFTQMECAPLLVVTSRLADERLWSEVLNLGGYNVLAKPLNTKEVFHVVGMAGLFWEGQSETSQRYAPRQLAKTA